MKPGGEGRHHKQQHRLDEEEAKSDVIGSRYRADQWASFKATRNPPYRHRAADAVLPRVIIRGRNHGHSPDSHGHVPQLGSFEHMSGGEERVHVHVDEGLRPCSHLFRLRLEAVSGH
jgi:hypothetical protein